MDSYHMLCRCFFFSRSMSSGAIRSLSKYVWNLHPIIITSYGPFCAFLRNILGGMKAASLHAAEQVGWPSGICRPQEFKMCERGKKAARRVERLCYSARNVMMMLGVGGCWNQVYEGSAASWDASLERQSTHRNFHVFSPLQSGSKESSSIRFPASVSRRKSLESRGVVAVVGRSIGWFGLVSLVHPMCVKGLYFFTVLTGLAASGERPLVWCEWRIWVYWLCFDLLWVADQQ